MWDESVQGRKSSFWMKVALRTSKWTNDESNFVEFLIAHMLLTPVWLVFMLRYFFQSTVCFKSFVTWIIKLYNFFNICIRGIIQSVMEKFWAGQLQYKQKAQKILKFQRSQGRQKIKVFPQGTYMAQNFISKTSTILWQKEVFQKHQSSIINSFIFIHSLMRANDKNVPLIVCDFHMKWGKRERFQGFIFEILRVVDLLGEKFTFFNSLGTTRISRSLRLSVYINVVLLMNFQEQFELCFHFKYLRSYKVLSKGSLSKASKFNHKFIHIHSFFDESKWQKCTFNRLWLSHEMR